MLLFPCSPACDSYRTHPLSLALFVAVCGVAVHMS